MTKRNRRPASGTPSRTESAGQTAPPTPEYYEASIYSDPKPLPPAMVAVVRDLESELKLPVWLWIQSDDSPYGEISAFLYQKVLGNRHAIPRNQKIAIIVESPGGAISDAYRIARFLKRHCGGFIAIVPSWAKSAATLLCLGADRIILAEHGELGPIDAQVHVPEIGRQRSVLNEVQTLERLNAFALRSLDETMQLLLRRTGMRVDHLIPETMKFVDNLMRPLMEGIDTTRWTEMSRVLKVGEEYAIRLLRNSYRKDGEAEDIARALVEKYPEHGFVIDHVEAKSRGLKVEKPTQQLAAILDRLMPFLTVTAIGPLRVQEHENNN